MSEIEHFWLASLLFCAGLTLILTRKNEIFILLGIELLFNAANVNIVGLHKSGAEGNSAYILILLVIAAAETCVGLALLYNLKRSL